MPKLAKMYPLAELPAAESYQPEQVRLNAWRCYECDLWAPYTHGGVFHPPICGRCEGPLELERRPT